MKDKLDGKIMTKFAGLSAKVCSYLLNDYSERYKTKRHKKVSHKKKT